MENFWRTILWQQFGAILEMYEQTLHACPDELWREPLWHDPTDDPAYTEFWFIAYHTLFWLDVYLTGSRDGFVPPVPFVAGRLPAKPYTKAELLVYLAHCRHKCRATLAAMSDEKAQQPYLFPWDEEVSFAEMQIHSLRHVQEHTSQLSLLLGRKGVAAPDWVPNIKAV